MLNYKKVVLYIGLAKGIENPKGWLPSIDFYYTTGEYSGTLSPEHVFKLRRVLDSLIKRPIFDEQKGSVYISEKIKKMTVRVKFEEYDLVGGVITLDFNSNASLVIDIKKDGPPLLRAINTI